MVSEAPIRRSIVVESVQSATGDVCRQIVSELKANNFDDEDVFAIHLALEEAFLNALKHGNKMEGDKEIKVDYTVDSDKIEVSMTDAGNGFDPENVPDPRAGENVYKAEGRGLFLMRSYMDEVSYNERGNCVRMVRYKEKPRLAETPEQMQA